jgi:hypothetical protein
MCVNNQPIHTVESLFSIQNDTNPDRTAEIIESEIHGLFQKIILNEKPTNIIAIENKGWNLYQPYLKKLVGFHQISRLKPFQYSNSPRLLMYSSINPNNDTILLTDAVKFGNEINRLLGDQFLKRFFAKDRITKVVGYLATKEGLENIHEKNPEITLNFVKIVDSIPEYEDEQKRMRLVYQIRMEPIDGEHPYTMLRTDTRNIGVDNLKSIIKSAVPDFYSGEYEVTDDILKIKSKKSITIHFFNPEGFKLNLKEFSNNTFNFEKIAIRLKFSPKDSILRVMGVAMTDDKRDYFSMFSRLMKGKCRQNFPYKACQLYYPLKRFYILKSDFCPMCIDNNISRYVISSFIESAEKNSEYIKMKWEIFEIYTGV